MKGALLKTAKRKTRKDDLNFREAREEAREADKQSERKGIDKKFTTLKLAGDTKDAGGALEGGLMAPTDDQLAKINQFTRSPKSADDVVCFPTLSCNDIVDRDFDQFTTDTIKGFAGLEQPFSSVGKSYMVGHDYSKLPVGRIFDVDTKKVDGNLHLQNWVYIPNTETNKSFIENLDFGINWAVSVGVTLGKSGCSICDSPMSSWFGMCYGAGHFKGAYYDPSSDEVDDWGYALEADPKDKKAVLCFNKLEDPVDFYELSQVYLGAQYFAALDEKSALASVVKQAGSASTSYVALSTEEAKELPLQREPLKVREAREKYALERDEEGSLKWVDSSGLLWTYNPEEDDEVLCLGKTATNKEGDDGTTDQEDTEGASSSEQQSDVSDDGDSEGGQLEDEQRSVDVPEDEQSEGADGKRLEVDQSDADPDSVDAESKAQDDEEEDQDMQDKTVRAAAEKAHVPQELLDAAAAKGGPLLDGLISKFVEERRKLSGMAEVAQKYLEDLRADAIGWYVRANQTEDQKAVNTETFERILSACGDDVDLIKSLIDEKKQLAQAKFPGAVRRSSFPDNANSEGGNLRRLPDEEDWDDENDQRVERLHG